MGEETEDQIQLSFAGMAKIMGNTGKNHVMAVLKAGKKSVGICGWRSHVELCADHENRHVSADRLSKIRAKLKIVDRCANIGA